MQVCFCISTGVVPMHWTILSFSKHLILAWWRVRPCRFFLRSAGVVTFIFGFHGGFVFMGFLISDCSFLWRMQISWQYSSEVSSVYPASIYCNIIFIAGHCIFVSSLLLLSCCMSKYAHARDVASSKYLSANHYAFHFQPCRQERM